jgi:preprotein translocase subunit YajC
VETQQVIILIGGLVLLGVLMFWPQWQARRRQRKRLAELRVGDEIVTVGGIIGKLTYFNAEEDRARIEIAPGVAMEVLSAAISRTVTSS